MPENPALDTADDLVEQVRAELTDLIAAPVGPWSLTTTDDPANSGGDGADWRPVSLPSAVPGVSVAWFRATVEAPASHHGWPVTDGTLTLAVRARHNADVYVNGRYLTRVGRGERRVELARAARAGETFHVALRVLGPASREEDTSEGSTSRGIGLDAAALEFGTLAEVRAAVLDHLDRMEVSRQMIALAGQGEYVLRQAASEIDRAAIARGDRLAVLDSISRANDSLTGLDDLFKRYTISLTANAHIDMAWLWDREETKQVTHDTFRSVLDLMNDYPDFIFAQSQAQAYAWVEEYWPRMFEEIRARVKEGRWEIVGGMWVEPDGNLPNGESFVRQVLHGKRYFRDKFGVDVTLGWNPDSFGYNGSLPQVYRKSGIHAFLTQKLTWNDTNVWPHRAFWWESPDGSRIFAYFPTDYVGHVRGRGLIKDLAAFASATGYTRTDHLYGIGDHGGGPTRDMLDRANALSEQTPFPRVRHQRAHDFIETLIAEANQPAVTIPVWNSELYLEYHRGTYTSQAAIKKGNREAERLLRDAEAFSVMAAGLGSPYPRETLDALWKITLFNQFHDILPGSCIGAVARDAWDDYARVREEGGATLDAALTAIAARMGAPGDGAHVAVFNGLGYAREEVAAIPLADLGLPAGEPVRVLRGNGTEAPSQIVDDDGEQTLLFIAAVPALGAASFRVLPGEPAAPDTGLDASENHVENAALRVEIAQDGTFSRVFSKEAGFEVLAPGEAGNVLQAFVDEPGKWEAWEIDRDFEREGERLRGPVRIDVLESGPVRARVRTTRTWSNSTFVQDIILTSGSRRVDVVNRVNWQHRRRLLKVLFPVNVQSSEATYETPFAAIARGTGDETSHDKARFEVPALQWADLSDGNKGVALLNDSKHGYDVKGHRMRLTLLRGPNSPDPNCDRGEHIFTYSLAPHAGDWRNGVYAEAYDLNNPLITRALPRGDGPNEASFLRLGGENVMLSALKRAEDSDAVIVRFFETAGQDGTATLTFREPPTAVYETDMLENEIALVETDGPIITVPLDHHEVKTLKVRFS